MIAWYSPSCWELGRCDRISGFPMLENGVLHTHPYLGGWVGGGCGGRQFQVERPSSWEAHLGKGAGGGMCGAWDGLILGQGSLRDPLGTLDRLGSLGVGQGWVDTWWVEGGHTWWVQGVCGWGLGWINSPTCLLGQQDTKGTNGRHIQAIGAYPNL